MKHDIVDLFHGAIWPDDYGSTASEPSPEPAPPSEKPSESEPKPSPQPGPSTDKPSGSQTGCMAVMMPRVITRAMIEKFSGTVKWDRADSGLPPLPKRIRQLVEERRKRFSQPGFQK